MTDLLSLSDIQSRLQAQAQTRVAIEDAYRIVQQMQAAYEADRAASANAIDVRDSQINILEARVATLQAKLAIATADVHVTIGTTGTISRTVPAVSFVENPPIWTSASWPVAKASLAQCAGAYKVHLKDFGLLDPWPDPAKPMVWTGNHLGGALAKIREVDANAPIVLTLYGAPWWMKSAGDAPLTAADAYSEKGRVTFEKLPQWLQLVDAAVELAAKAGVRDFEVWNECKGYYTDPWDMSMVGQAGKPVGYGYFYQQTAAQIKATMLHLGFMRADYRIAGPYVVFATRGDKTADALPDTHPLNVNAAKYGYIQKQPVNALRDFLRNARDNALPLDTLALDASTYLKSGAYPSANPFDYLQKFEDLLTYAESCLTEFGFDPHMRKAFSELYPTPDPIHQTADSEQLRAALWADTLRMCVLHGVRYPLMWGPTSPAGGNFHELGGLIDASGALQATGDVFQLFRDHFGSGVTVYQVTCSDSRVDGLASADTLLIYSKVPDALTVDVAGKVVELAGYAWATVQRE